MKFSSGWAVVRAASRIGVGRLGAVRVLRAARAVAWWLIDAHRSITFPFRHPRLWWLVWRIRGHDWFGLPMPSVEGYNCLKA